MKTDLLTKVCNFIKKDNLFLFILFCLLLPSQIFNFPSSGLDSSWVIALNLALKNGLCFGKDFIFTYGPLGFLMTHLGTEVFFGNILILLFDIFLIANFLFIANKLLKENNSYLTYVLVFLVIYHLSYTDNIHRSLAIILFYLLMNIKNINYSTYAIAGILIGFLFFIKPSAGMFFFMAYLITSGYIFLTTRNWKVVFYPLGFIILIFLSTLFLHVDLLAYISSATELTSTYSDTMNAIEYTKLAAYGFLLLALCSIFILTLACYLIWQKSKDYYSILMFSIVAMFLFYSFKQSYVRFDGHIQSFWNNFLPIALIFLYFNIDHVNKIVKLLYFFLVFISFVALTLYNGKMVSKYIFCLPPISYLYEITSGQNETMYLQSVELEKMPERIKKIIGKATIDVFPVDIASLYFNNLNYRNRPIIQSYVTVSTSLNLINKNYFESTNSSEFILYNNGSIDTRYPFWDESLAKKTVLANYDPIDSIFEWRRPNYSSFLLKKRQCPLAFEEHLVNNTTIEFNKEYKLPDTNNQLYLSANIDYSILGKLMKLSFQPPMVKINLYFEDGSESQYRIVVPELKHGVLINKKVVTTLDAYLLYKYKGAKNSCIKRFMLVNNSSAYKPNIEISFSELYFKN